MSDVLDLPVPFEHRRGVRLAGGVVLAVIVASMFGLKGPRAALYLMPLGVAIFLMGRPQGRDARRLALEADHLLAWPPDGTSPDRLALSRLVLRWDGDHLLAEDGGVPVGLGRGANARKAEAWLKARLSV